MLRRSFLLGLVGALAVSASSASPESDFHQEHAAWRAERVTRLTAPDGWLSIIGLHWLDEGSNTLGRAASNRHQLASGPAQLGRVERHGDNVRFFPVAGVSVTVDDMVFEQGDAAGVVLEYRGARPTVVRAGTLSFFVIQRGEKLGLRVRDREAPRRRDFAGLDYFPPSPAWRIEADWVPFEPAREIPITNMIGQTSPGKVPGKAVFVHDGRTYELLPLAESANETLFFIIADETGGEETYEAARFIYAEPPRNGKVILDFNRAQNPPCAFTPFATCPFPPKENRLPFRVTAGEKNYRGEH